jgi:protein-S-isoprenylcysteine O-methyltransferase Ste14
MTVTGPVATISRIGRHGGWFLAFGILTVAMGIAAVVWPAITLLAAAIVFGVQLIFAGIYRSVRSPLRTPAARPGSCLRCWASCRWSWACMRCAMCC